MNSIQKAYSYIDSAYPEMIYTLQKWVSVPSLKADPAPDAPFGKEIRRMLDIAMDDCSHLGLPTQVFDGYAAHAEIGEGSDDDALAILVHLDVVPEGDGWHFPPYGAVIENDRMYGRGTSDDKGPAVAALYAVKAVKEANIPLKRKVKLIFGCDEESGSECIEHYKKVSTMPRSGFSPDASYPIINIEKGIIRVKLIGKTAADGLQVISFNTGERPNVVPGKAEAIVSGGADLLSKIKEISSEFDFPVIAELADENAVCITVTGVTGHAAYPESARNAIGEMLLVLRRLGAQGAISALADKVGMEYNGNSMKISVQDGISGYLTSNLGIIRCNGTTVEAILDIRYPVMANPEYIVKNIQDSFPSFDVQATKPVIPHYVPESSELVQCLLDSYCELTGLERKCLYTGGGTYAKELEEGVAFGASFPGSEDLAHQANEYIILEELKKNAKIFASAIVKLAGKA